jgi:electron transfer flavoprotein beta subunit
MEILVCVARVPDTAENEIELNSAGSDIERDDLVYSVNEWDNYAVEEAIQIVERVGGSVTVITVGDDESEEVLRREMAMGANNGILLSDDSFEDTDGRGIATILKAAVSQGNYDLILTGAQSEGGAGEVGGMLAAMLDLPYASLVVSIEESGDSLKIGREIEGGNIEMNEISQPCVLSIQTGINEPRYVGIRGIRKVASVDIPVKSAGDLGLTADSISSEVKRLDYFVPEMGEGAEMLEGDNDEIIAKLIEMLKAKGGLK